MSNKKKLIGIYIIIGIFVVIGLFEYVLNIKLGNKDTNKVKEEVSYKIIDNDDSRFYNVYTSLMNYTGTSNRSNGYKSFTESELVSTISNSLNDSDFIFTKSYDKNIKSYYYNLRGSTIKDLLKSIFGDVEVDFNEVLSNSKGFNVNTSYGNYMYLVKYNSDSDILSCLFTNINNSETYNNNIIRKINKVELEDDYITVYESVIYLKYLDKSIEIFNDSNMTDKLDKIDIEDKIDIDKYEDSGEIISLYKYNSKDKKYYFDGSYIR